MFSLVVASEGNTFSHRHQLWFGLPFGCTILGNKSPVFCLTFDAVDIWKGFFSLNIFFFFFCWCFPEIFSFFLNAWLDFLYHCLSVSFCCNLFPKNCGCVLIINWYIDDFLFLYFFGVMLTLAYLLYSCACRLADSYRCMLFLMHVYYILSCTL